MNDFRDRRLQPASETAGFSPQLLHWMLLAIFLLISSSVANAQQTGAAILQQVDIEQKLNSQVPLDLKFTKEDGSIVQLKDLLAGKPTILTLVYYECPMLCTQVLNGLVSSIRPLKFTPGKEFNIITISFDPKETSTLANAKKAVYMKEYARDNAERGWHFLTGTEESIRQVTEAVGFKYDYDPKSGQFAHGSAIMVLTPEGKAARYFYGIEYSTRDLRLALVEASENKIGTIADKVLLLCFHYDPTVGKYSAYAINMIRAGGVLTVLFLGGFILRMRRKEAKNV